MEHVQERRTAKRIRVTQLQYYVYRLAIIPKASRSLTIASCLKKHPLWTKFNILYLNQNMRALSTEKAFSEWLLDVVNCKDDFNTVTPCQLKGRAISTVTNDLSIVFNNDVLELLPGITKIYESVDTVISDDPQDQLSYPEEFLNTITPTGMPLHKLKIKKGAIIMLLRSLMPSKGLCNGTRLIVTNLQRNLIEAKLIDGDEATPSLNYLVFSIMSIMKDKSASQRGSLSSKNV
ncbi:uncharacterized protein [Parasteatoda tepidariorum]|uniref:uncharacterized protein n=1 Tax=Parasteatoda tepidariorum TaxID=114398 RepID=UPI0039BC9522